LQALTRFGNVNACGCEIGEISHELDCRATTDITDGVELLSVANLPRKLVHFLLAIVCPIGIREIVEISGIWAC
jgi:hypothetical protein